VLIIKQKIILSKESLIASPLRKGMDFVSFSIFLHFLAKHVINFIEKMGFSAEALSQQQYGNNNWK
jgi:hypothetical protein